MCGSHSGTYEELYLWEYNAVSSVEIQPEEHVACAFGVEE
jgi:hypothetical protein